MYPSRQRGKPRWDLREPESNNQRYNQAWDTNPRMNEQQFNVNQYSPRLDRVEVNLTARER